MGALFGTLAKSYGMSKLGGGGDKQQEDGDANDPRLLNPKYAMSEQSKTKPRSGGGGVFDQMFNQAMSRSRPGGGDAVPGGDFGTSRETLAMKPDSPFMVRTDFDGVRFDPMQDKFQGGMMTMDDFDRLVRMQGLQGGMMMSDFDRRNRGY